MDSITLGVGTLRATIALVAIFLASSCLADARAEVGGGHTVPECVYFESFDFGRWTAPGLEGRVVRETDAGLTPFAGVYVIAERKIDRITEIAVSDHEGNFDFGSLPVGVYDVRTCQDGYDELSFQLTIERPSNGVEFVLVVGPSEAIGHREVRAYDEHGSAVEPLPVAQQQ